MPFITEEIYQALPHSIADVANAKNRARNLKAGNETDTAYAPDDEEPMLILRTYPKFSNSLNFPKEEADFESIMSVIRAIRSRRADMKVPPSKKSALTIVTERPEIFEASRAYISRLAYANSLTITGEAPEDLSNLVTATTNDARLFMPLAELVDVEKERERIEKEIVKIKNSMDRVEQKLSNNQFTAKAPEEVVKAERDKLDKLRALMDNLNDSLRELG